MLLNSPVVSRTFSLVLAHARRKLFISGCFGRRKLWTDVEMQNGIRRSSRLAALPLPTKSNRFYSSNRSAGNAVKVEHDSKLGLFFVDIQGIGRAYLEYEREGNLMMIKHTQVPDELEGRGLGRILAQAALQYIEKNDLRAEIQCDYVRHVVQKYEPKYIKYINEK